MRLRTVSLRPARDRFVLLIAALSAICFALPVSPAPSLAGARAGDDPLLSIGEPSAATGSAADGGQGDSPAGIRVEAPSMALARGPILLTVEVADNLEAGLRVNLGGSCTFRGDVLEGSMLEGAGSSSALLALHEGRARVLVSDPVAEEITIVVEGVTDEVRDLPPSQHVLRIVSESGDDDEDGLSNLEEFDRGTSPLAADSDGDAVPDARDNCPSIPNPDQSDVIHVNGTGDACDDPDLDGLFDNVDRCRDRWNAIPRGRNLDWARDVCAEQAVQAGLAGPTVVLPFQVTDAAFDPGRPYVYVSDKAGKKVYFVNLTTGLIEKEFAFDLMPESLALTPDGSRLFVALLTREHSCCWWDEDGHEGYIASFDLATQVKIRQFRIVEDPFDLVATNNGYLVVSSGSGQWTYVRSFNASTGALTGTLAYSVYERARLALHPSGIAIYGAGDYPDLFRFDLQAGGGIVYRWNAPYDGTYHRMNGNVWPSPQGNLLVTRGGDAFGVGSTSTTDMRFIQSLSVGAIEGTVFDPARQVLFTAEGSALHYYNLTSRFEIGSQALSGPGAFLGMKGDLIYALIRGSTQTTLVAVEHPVLNGASNTPPVADFTITPATGGTTRSDFRFDASVSTDAQDALGALQFRWDFDNDGVWDTAFSSDPVATKRFLTAGTKVIRLQVRDSLALISDKAQTVDVAFEADPGEPGPSNPPFELPFAATDAAFDPVRPYLYVSDRVSKTVSFVNLTSGFIEKQFTFDLTPEALAVTPDGTRLFAALLTREHSSYWFDGHEGYIASFDLEAQVKDRQFRITEDPYDVLATNDGFLIVSSGSGQWTNIRVFNAVSGAQTGTTGSIYERARLAAHPSGTAIYAASTAIFPSDIYRLDRQPAGAIAYRWDSPYHGDHRMEGNVWASPAGDILITRGGDIFSVGSTSATDMRFIQPLSAGNIEDLVFDTASHVVFTIEGSALHYYNLASRIEIGTQSLAGSGSFLGARGDKVYALVPVSGRTTVATFAHPAPNGASNTPPMADFTMTPSSGGTTRTDFRFDASTSSDEQDALAALRFRWDFDNNGTWDTAFSSDPIVMKRFTTAGTKVIRVQVRDSLALVSDKTRTVDVAFEADPGEPGPSNPPFELPFAVTDAAFDPQRPYLYVSDKAGKKVYFVNLTSGFIEKQFSFDLLPETLGLTPDGSRLFVTLLAQDHFYFAGDPGQIASFDLSAGVKDRQFVLPMDPRDLLATSDGHVVVSPFGIGGSVRVFDAATGAQTGSTNDLYPRSALRLTLHPSERIVYGADSGVSPDDILRLDLTPGGGISYRWDSRYHGDHRMGGNIWASPVGDVVITRGGDVFSAGSTQADDMLFVHSLTSSLIDDLTFDSARQVFFTIEGTALRFYNLASRFEIGSQVLSGAGSFVGVQGERVYALIRSTDRTSVVSIAHPALNGASNTAPAADFTITPASGGTTLTSFRFDASSSSDAQDALASLKFRWDFDNDGAWDSAFSSDPVVTKRFVTAGTKVIRLQVRDSLSLVSELTRSLDVAFEADPGEPGPSNPAYELPFAVTDAVIDPVRPYLYVSDKAGKKVYFVNLKTGFVEKQFTFDLMPEALALTPDASRLFVALLTREHSYYWWNEDGHEGYIASFDLSAQVKDRHFRITEDPFDLLATSGGSLVVSSGSGQWTYVRVFNAATGALTGSSYSVYQGARLATHPSGTAIYGADTGLSPSDIFRMDLLPGGGIAYRWDSPYHGDHRMNGNVWPSPLGDILITRGGDVFSVGNSAATDMRFVRSLSQASITDLAWDVSRDLIIALEGSTVRRYRLSNFTLVGSTLIDGGVFMGRHGPVLFTLVPQTASKTLLIRDPVQNRAPVAAMGQDEVVECSGPLGAPVLLDGSTSSDPDSMPGTNDDIASFAWYEDYGLTTQRALGTGATRSITLPLGGHALTLVVTDRTGSTGFVSKVVTVADTIPPSLSVAPEPNILWPPNHQMVPVHVAWQAHDACQPNPAVTLVSLTSSEPDDAQGMEDGDTDGDVGGTEPGATAGELSLRAERDGRGPGRTYTLSYLAVDGSGNGTPAIGIVTVPHDQGAGPEPLLMRLEPNGWPGMVRIFWAGLPDALGYDVISGELSQARVEDNRLSLGHVRVLARGTMETSLNEGSPGALPAPGKVFFYLIQRRTDRGGDGFGTESAPWPRVPASCDGGCP